MAKRDVAYDGITKAVYNTLISTNVLDSNGENANIVDAVNSLAEAIRVGLQQLGNGGASTPMGAIEAHGCAIIEAADKISYSISELSYAIRSLKLK